MPPHLVGNRTSDFPLVMLACLAALQIGVSAVDSAPRPIAEWLHSTWTAKHGVPADIRALAQTKDGYLWVGTALGLVRFDGVRFVPFTPGTDTLKSVAVRRLLASRDGGLWIVWGGGGVSRFHRDTLTTYGEADGLPTTFDLTESSSGVLVAGTSKGLFRFVDGKWNGASDDWRFPKTQSQGVWFDRDEVLWAQTPDRVLYLPADSQRFVDSGTQLTSAPVPAQFAQAKDGTIWMAELPRSAHTLRKPGDQRPLSEVMVGAWTILVDRKGSLWIGSLGDGVRRVLDPARIAGRQIAQFGSEIEHITMRNGLQSDFIYALLEDREGGIWVATRRGLSHFREGAFTPGPTRGAVRERFVRAARDSSVWVVAASVPGFLRFRSGRQEVFTESLLNPRNLFHDDKGVLWTVGREGVFRFQGRGFERIPLRAGAVRAAADVIVDSTGAVWVVEAASGLLRLTGDSLVLVSRLPPSVDPRAHLSLDRRGRIWIRQFDQLALYDRGQLRVFAAAKNEAPLSVAGIFEDRAGNIWAVGRSGVSRFEGDRFRTLPERQGVPGRAVYGIADDESGAWWVVAQSGVLRVPPGEFERAMADSSYTIRFRRFDHQDGLPGAIAGTPEGPVVTRAADGMIWVATDSGVASIDPRNLADADAPPVLIETVRVDGRQLPRSNEITIPPESRDLEIDYTATILSIPERVHFRYQLEGEDRGWHDVGARRRAYYAGLDPGTYRFRVSARHVDGVWSDSGAVLTLRVLPAWYQTLWFRAAVALMIGALGATAAFLFQRRRHARAHAALAARYEATLAERARIAQDLHDTLLQGFAGVTLQLKTAELALPEQPDVAVETIFRVQRLARESLREARERVWDMRRTESSGDDLPAALEAIARDRSAGTDLDVSVVTAGERRRLTRPVEDAALRIAREAIVNALRHAEARRIEIHVVFGATSLRMEVRDDGRGFTPDEAEQARRRGHFGLSGARERAANMGGRCDIRTRPGGGTVVAVELPLVESNVG